MEDFIYIYLRILPYAVLFHMQGQPLDTKIYRNINSMYYPLLSYCSTSFWKCRGCPFQALLLLAPRLEDAIFILQRLLISLVGPDWGLQFIPLNFQCVANLRETASWSDLIVICGYLYFEFCFVRRLLVWSTLLGVTDRRASQRGFGAMDSVSRQSNPCRLVSDSAWSRGVMRSWNLFLVKAGNRHRNGKGIQMLSNSDLFSDLPSAKSGHV